MVSTPLIIILALVLVSVTISYITLTLTGEGQPKIEKPTFIDFSLKQEGSSILIQNTGINNISAESLEVYLVSTLTQVTNKNNIPPGSTYTIKISELPSFEGKTNITITLDNVNRSLEIVSIREVTTPVSEVFPKPAETIVQPIPSVKFYTIFVGTQGNGKVTLVPNASEYEEGTEVEVNATPDINYTFGYWFLDGVILYGSSQIIKMDKNHSLEAVFLIRSDIDCVRNNPTILITPSNPSKYMGMTFSVNIKNNNVKCYAESFEITISCPSDFTCEKRDSAILIDSESNASTTITINPKNASSISAGTYSLSITAKNGADTSYRSTNSSSYKIFSNLVRPVIFFTKNYTLDATLVNFFEEKIFEIRKFYFDNNNNKTFQSLPLSTVMGDDYNEFYWCNGTTDCAVANQFEGNIITELKNKGYPVHQDWNQFPANRIVWVLAIGGGGFAGGRQYPTGGGFAMVGDAAIYGYIDNSCDRVKDKYFSVDNHPNAVDHCQNTWLPSGKIYGYGVGALAHELGHAFGLPHPDTYGYPSGSVQWSQTVMGEHWNYPNTGLLNEDRSRLATSKFFLN